MKMLNALLIVGLMSTSVAAMAEDGGDRTMARMDTAREVSMNNYSQAQMAKAEQNGKTLSSAQKTPDASVQSND